MNHYLNCCYKSEPGFAFREMSMKKDTALIRFEVIKTGVTSNGVAKKVSDILNQLTGYTFQLFMC